jgi:hypothetical protein
MASRTDELGRAFKKSQLQVQLYVNRRQPKLTAAVVNALPALAELHPQLTWVSPLEAERFAERYDEAFVRAIDRQDLVKPLRKFWPSGGPHWDALAVAHGPDGDYLGPVLVEGKSYPGEMRSRLAAKNPVSRHRILARLAEARAWLRVSEDHADAWSERYYQAANRIAFLYWFHDVLDERAWLANVCFLDDPDYPTTKQRWDKALPKVERALGLEAVHVPGKGGIFLIAGRRDELLVSPPADSGVS